MEDPKVGERLFIGAFAGIGLLSVAGALYQRDLSILLVPLAFVLVCLGVALLYAATLGPVLYVVSKIFK